MRMTLSEKGPVVAPPVLDEPMRRVSTSVLSWPGVIGATHWHLYRPTDVDGADFYVGEEELGHIHLQGDVHLATSPGLRRALVELGLAKPFPFAGYDDWVLFCIRDETDADQAEWLFRLAYDLLRGEAEDALIERIVTRVAA